MLAGADLDEGDRAVLRLCALKQVVAPGVARRDDARSDHLEVGDLLVDLGKLGLRPRLQTRRATVMMSPRLEKLCDLIQRETEVLRGFDDTQRRDGLLGVEAVPSKAAFRCLDDATTLVVAKRFDVDPDGFGDLPGS